MLGQLIDTSQWGSQEWLAAVIFAFIGVTIAVIIRRLFKSKRPLCKELSLLSKFFCKIHIPT